MGVSTDAWRARIGAFLPTASSLSCRQQWGTYERRVLSKTYKSPPNGPKTHHVNMEILVCLILLLVACISSWTDPLKGISDLGFFRVAVSSILMHLGFNHQKEKTAKNLALGAALMVLLLLCGDVESNPGPNGMKSKQETDICDSRLPKVSVKVHKIHRIDTSDKFGTSAPSLEILWTKIREKWNDVDQTSYILSEEDGTDISDEGYFQSLENKMVLQICPKNMDCTSVDSVSRLTDHMIQEIVNNRIHDKDVTALGVAMGLPMPRINRYREQNTNCECMGTFNMILDWRNGTPPRNQIQNFCGILDEAKLKELSEDLLHGKIFNSDKMKDERVLNTLQDLCKVKYIEELSHLSKSPVDEGLPLPIETNFKDPLLFRPLNMHSQDDATSSPSADDMNYLKEDMVEYLVDSFRSIFLIEENGYLPKRILILGKAGVGKTTMLRKIALDWTYIQANEGSYLSEVKLVIYLSLKEVAKNASLGGEVIRQILPKDTRIRSDEVEKCIRLHGENILILLDDFEKSVFKDLSPDTKCESLFDAICKRQFVFNRIIVTTSSLMSKIFTPYISLVLKGYSSDSF